MRLVAQVPYYREVKWTWKAPGVSLSHRADKEQQKEPRPFICMSCVQLNNVGQLKRKSKEWNSGAVENSVLSRAKVQRKLLSVGSKIDTYC
jgi:hypothetical protein